MSFQSPLLKQSADIVNGPTVYDPLIDSSCVWQACLIPSLSRTLAAGYWALSPDEEQEEHSAKQVTLTTTQ